MFYSNTKRRQSVYMGIKIGRKIKYRNTDVVNFS